MCCIVLAVLPLNVAHVNNVDVDFPVNGECAPRTLTAAAVKLLPQQQQQQAQQLLTQTTSIPMLNARQLAAISDLALHFNVLLLLFILFFFFATQFAQFGSRCEFQRTNLLLFFSMSAVVAVIYARIFIPDSTFCNNMWHR